MNGPICWREVDHRHDEAMQQFLLGVVPGQLRRRLLQADLGAEVDLELVGRFSGGREILDPDDPADADVDALELGVGKRCRLIRHCVKT
jgi:hypothetical protein